MRGFHQFEHFLIDDFGGACGILVVQRSKVALLVIRPLDGTQFVGETVVEHHLTCDVRRLFDVVGSTGGRIVEHDLFRGTTAHSVRHLVEQLVA